MAVKTIKITNCPDCGCGEQECATIGVVCGCCRDFSFMPGATSTDFYNYLLSCPRCGAHWEGHTPPSPCNDPYGEPYPTSQTLETSFPNPSYMCQNQYNSGHWELVPDLSIAISIRVPGTDIYDNCGNKIEIEE